MAKHTSTFRGTEREHAMQAVDDYRTSIKYAKLAIRASKHSESGCKFALEATESMNWSLGKGRAEHRYAPGQHDVMQANHAARRWMHLARSAFRKRCQVVPR